MRGEHLFRWGAEGLKLTGAAEYGKIPFVRQLLPLSMSLETHRLTLLPCSPEHLLMLIDQPERFEQVLGMPAADGLRGFFVSDDVSPDWLAALRNSSGPDPWRHGFFVVHRDSGSVIGSAGFKGPPDSTGRTRCHKRTRPRAYF